MKKKWFGLGLIIFSCIGIFSSFTNVFNEEMGQDQNKYDLALRQVAHNLYKAKGNLKSKISPVEHLDSDTYRIKIEHDLEYSKLPQFMEEAIRDYDLNSNYNVAIKNCNKDSILLGFNSVAQSNGNAACQGREHNITCSYIEVMFEQKKQWLSAETLTYIVLLLSGIIVLLLGSRKPNSQDSLHSDNSSKEEHLFIGKFKYDPENLTVSMDDLVTTLTFRENKLLNFLFKNANQVIKREDILSHVWEEEGVIVGRSLDVFISRLRKILRPDPLVEIKNVHGVGYRLVIG